MTRLDALTKLRDAWRIGLWVPELLPNVPELHTDLTWKTFEGSTDAGLSLFKAVLPGYCPVIDVVAGEVILYEDVGDDEWEHRHEARSTDPARALLLAIAEALIAREETDDKA